MISLKELKEIAIGNEILCLDINNRGEYRLVNVDLLDDKYKDYYVTTIDSVDYKLIACSIVPYKTLNIDN